MHACMHVGVCARSRACVRACVRAEGGRGVWVFVCGDVMCDATGPDVGLIWGAGDPALCRACLPFRTAYHGLLT